MFINFLGFQRIENCVALIFRLSVLSSFDFSFSFYRRALPQKMCSQLWNQIYCRQGRRAGWVSSSAYIRNISMCIIRTQGRRKNGVITLNWGSIFSCFFLLFRGGSWFFIHTGLCRKSNLRWNFRFPPGTTQAGRCLTAVLNGNRYTSRDKRRHSKDYFCSR